MKANSKAWSDNEVMSAIQRQDKLYNKFKYSGLETHKDNLKVVEIHLQKVILNKNKSYYEEELAKIRNFRI